MVPSKNVNVGICLNSVRASNIESGVPEMQNYGVVVKLFWRPSLASASVFVRWQLHRQRKSLTVPEFDSDSTIQSCKFGCHRWSDINDGQCRCVWWRWHCNWATEITEVQHSQTSLSGCRRTITTPSWAPHSSTTSTVTARTVCKKGKRYGFI